jgi:glycosyltransferase involved in cell wall biosynthesis
MKVLHIISSLKVGGAESLLVQLVPGLKDQGVDNYVLYFHEGPNSERLEKAGIPVYNVCGKFWRYSPLFFIKVFWLIKKIRPTHIHSHLWLATVIANLYGDVLGIPVATTIHLISTGEKSGTVSRFRYWVDKFVLRLSRQFVLVSQSMEAEFKELYSFVPAKKISVIQNGIDVNLVRKLGFDGAANQQLKKNKRFVFGSVGRLIERKNFGALIKAFSLVAQEVGNCELLIVGNGPEKEKLLKLISNLSLGDRVQIISDSSAYKYYTLLDCYVSLSHEEGLSIAMLEAMSFDLPIILQSENNCDITVVNNLNGFLVREEKEAVLAMKQLAKDFKIAKQFGLASGELVREKFSLQRVVSSYKNIYQ